MMGEAHLVTRTHSPREEGAGGREERERGESEEGGGMGRRQTKINGRQSGIREEMGLDHCEDAESQGGTNGGGGKTGKGEEGEKHS